MYWFLWLLAALLIFLATLTLAFVLGRMTYKRTRHLTQNRILMVGTFLTATVLLFPVYLEVSFAEKGILEYAKTLVHSAFHAIRIFALEGDYAQYFDSEVVYAMKEPLQQIYSGFGTLLFILAPLLTLKAVISLFRDVVTYQKYVFAFHKHTHIFSELNEKSLELAKSIDKAYNRSAENPKKYKLHRKALIVFNGVTDEQETKNDLLEEAKEIGAICFSKDLDAVKYNKSKICKRRISFYLTSDNEETNVRHAENVMQSYDFPSVDVYVFSDDIRTELLLSAKRISYMKVVRINEAQSLIYHNLDVHGMRLFKNARPTDSDERVISAVIVGLGPHGTEMLKALSWFCQMDGYRFKVTAFDKDPDAKEKFTLACPELMDEAYNGKNIPGEARYEINVVGGVEVNSRAFTDAFSQITDATYVFVACGDDADNLSASLRIRVLCERILYPDGNRKPELETVIYHPSIAETMGEKWEGDFSSENPLGVTNFRNQPYGIHMIGSLEELYSVETLLNSSLIKEAEKANERYAQVVYQTALEDAAKKLSKEEFEKKKPLIEAQKQENLRAFHQYDYNYRSSLARIIHERKSDELGTRNTAQEHRRWNAYMRSMGYCFSGSEDERSRNDLARLHHNLVPVSSLRKKGDVEKDK